MDLTPIFRKEFFLDAIIKGTTPPEPIFREEYFLAKIAGADVVTPTPIFRIEKYLAKIGGEDVEIPDPVFREEYWLAKKCGENVTTPTPVFRLEYFLEEWVNGSAPAYQSVTGKIVSFLTQRIAPLKIEATLSPIQDLHGYENPWPPGGGKNLAKPYTYTNNNLVGTTVVYAGDGSCEIDGTATGTSGTPSVSAAVQNGYTITLPAGTYTISISGQTTEVNAEVYATATTTQLATLNSPTFTIAEQTTVLFRCGVRSGKTYNNQKCYLQLESGSTASTQFYPYSNECPISGHTGAEVYATGINVWDEEWEQGAYTNSGTKIANNTVMRCKNPIPVKPNTEYYFKTPAPATPYTARYVFYDENMTCISSTGGLNVNTAFTTPSNAYYFAFNMNSAYGTTYANDISINYPSTDHDYHAYVGSSVTVNFGQTVYGGELTVNEDGTGSVKARPYYASYNGETLVGPWVSSEDKYEPGATPTTGAQVVDMGGTETTIPLTPGQVEALQGQNVVWVDDSDEIKVTYRSN